MQRPLRNDLLLEKSIKNKAKLFNSSIKAIQLAIEKTIMKMMNLNAYSWILQNFVELHITEKSDKQTTKETLIWAHITISNAKRNLLNYHKIKRKYLPQARDS